MRLLRTHQIQVNEPTQPTVTLPSSFSSKPGYYDESEASTATDKNNAPKANAQGSIQEKKKPTAAAANDANKGFVYISHAAKYLQIFLQ